MENLLSLGPVVISTLGVFAALSFVIFSFVFWRRLKEDFEEEAILFLTILLLFSSFLGARFFYIFTHFSDFGFSFSWLFWRQFPGFSLAGALVGFVLCLFWWVAKRRWNLWPLADASLVAFSFAFLPMNIGIFLAGRNLFLLYRLVLSGFFLFLVLATAKNYRKLIWYRSGKPGFVATFGLAFLSFSLFGLEFFRKGVVSFNWEQAGYAYLGVASLFLLYFRSERIFRQDWQKMTETLMFFKKKKNG